VSDGGRFVERQVTLGVRNESQVAVLSGLQSGDRVRVD
jgi:multidrug efflux pump subunit AcrA (membrane-fusion protein)